MEKLIKPSYKAIFLDLDHTLWDYNKNSKETLEQLFVEYGLKTKYGISTEHFLRTFESVNRILWQDYDSGRIERDFIRTQRFKRILNKYFIDDEVLHLALSDEYLTRCPLKTHLLPHALSCLEYLKSKYSLFLVTNGFTDVQQNKLKHSGLTPFFHSVITSETTGHKKPSKEIFEYALSQSNTRAEDTLMIGDNLNSDISGALNARLHAMFYNPSGIKHSLKPHYEITCLSEISNIL